MRDKEVIRRGYDELAETYASRQSVDTREMKILNTFLSALSEPARVLDVGCEQGVPVLRRLCEETTAVGLDISAAQLRIAADTVSTAQLAHGDMSCLPFRNDAFDAYLRTIHSYTSRSMITNRPSRSSLVSCAPVRECSSPKRPLRPNAPTRIGSTATLR